MTLEKICREFEEYVASYLDRIDATGSYIRSDSLKSTFLKKGQEIAAKYKNQMTDEEKEAFENHYVQFTEQAIKIYKDELKDKNVVDSSLGNAGDIDEDPVIISGRTFYRDKTNIFSDYLATNKSFSMADSVASITIDTPYGSVTTVLGTLQTISYSIYQEKRPVRVLGNLNAKDWIAGKRTIAGSLVFAVFNKHWMIDIYDELKQQAKMKSWHFITDEIPPFNVTISFANEYGYDSKLVIYGVRILNEGQTISTNDVYIENTYQYVANDIDLMDSLSAYQGRQSKHMRASISVGETFGEDDSEEPGFVTGDEEEKPAEPDKDFNPDVFDISEEDLKNMTRQEALDKLRQTFLEQQDAHLDNPDEVQNIGTTYNQAVDRINEYYNKQEADKMESVNIGEE